MAAETVEYREVVRRVATGMQLLDGEGGLRPLDSMIFVALLAKIEVAIGFELPLEALGRTFDSLDALVEVVEQAARART